MSCKEKGMIGRISGVSQPSIVKGSEAFLFTQITYKGDKGDPVALAGFLGATGFFQAEEVSPLVIPGTLDSADLGQLKFEMTPAETEQLKAGEELSFEVAVEYDFGLVFFQFDSLLKVSKRLF